MKKILYYYLNFHSGSNGSVIYRLEDEKEDRIDEFDPSEFAAIVALLSQKQISYDTKSDTFVSYNEYKP